jgi:putative membrane protein
MRLVDIKLFRWPLVFRFIKGAIHAAILVPVCLHALFTAFVVYLDEYVFDTVGLPNSIVCYNRLLSRVV